MRSTFQHIRQQESFEQKGYSLIDSFLTKDEVRELREFYKNNTDNRLTGFHATMHSVDFALRAAVTEKITTVFKKKSDLLLDEYRAVVGNFTVKEPGIESFFDFHLDWNMLDESKARSVTIWVPLEDTNAENGNLWILEGSNHLADTYRCGPGLNLLAEKPHEFEEMRFEKKVLEMKAGDAIIYDHKLIHGSPPNLTQHARIAINLALLPKEVKALHYFYEKEQIKVYEVEDSFFHRCLTHEVMEMHAYDLKEKLDINFPSIDQSAMNKLVR